eukprot:288602_1
MSVSTSKKLSIQKKNKKELEDEIKQIKEENPANVVFEEHKTTTQLTSKYGEYNNDYPNGNNNNIHIKIKPIHIGLAGILNETLTPNNAHEISDSDNIQISFQQRTKLITIENRSTS